MRAKTIAVGLLCLFVIGCSTAPKSERARQDLATNANSALNNMVTNHPEINDAMKDAYGYAMFPSVGAGGLIVGGAYGRGVVYQGSTMIGYASITSVSAGAKAGGEAYDELLVFQDKAALDRMINNNLSLTADASAVVLKPGAAVATTFQNGVAVFVQPTGGAMVDVSVGGQSFKFEQVK